MDIIAIISLSLITLINGYWTWQSRKIQNDRDVIKSLQLQLSLKEEAIQQMINAKNELKRQYEHQISKNKHLEGELMTYKKFNKHLKT